MLLRLLREQRKKMVLKVYKGKYFRNNLLKFEVAMKGEMRFTRLDNQESVEVGYDLSNIVLSNFNPSLMQKVFKILQQKKNLKLWSCLAKKVKRDFNNS